MIWGKESPEVLRVDDVDVQHRAAECLLRGQVVAFPTDTVYGIGAHAFLPQAVAMLYDIKGRPPTKPIPLLLGSAAQVGDVALELPPDLHTLARAHWPGGLTVVLRKGPRVPSIASAGRDSIGVRVPDHPFVRALIREVGAPIATTSANLSGRPAPATAQEVLSGLQSGVDLIVDGGPCRGGVPSTVLDLTRHPPLVVREGAVSVDSLRRTIGELLTLAEVGPD